MLHTPHLFTRVTEYQPHTGNPFNPQTIVFLRNRVLLRESDLRIPSSDEITALVINPHRLLPVGIWQENYYQTTWIEHDSEAPSGYVFLKMNALFGRVGDDFLGLVGRAYQLTEWARTHRFCGVCATKTELKDNGGSYVCPSCNMQFYPRISPAVMVLICKENSVLLALHTQNKGAGNHIYTALAGFLEIGESIEEAIHREVFEEVGLRIHNLKYFGSQSWPFPHSLMIAFTADYLDGEIKIDPCEIAEVGWFGPEEEWPQTPPSVSIAAALIDAYRPKK